MSFYTFFFNHTWNFTKNKSLEIKNCSVKILQIIYILMALPATKLVMAICHRSKTLHLYVVTYSHRRILFRVTYLTVSQNRLFFMADQWLPRSCLCLKRLKTISHEETKSVFSCPRLNTKYITGPETSFNPSYLITDTPFKFWFVLLDKEKDLKEKDKDFKKIKEWTAWK